MLQARIGRAAEREGERGDHRAGRMPAAVAEEQDDAGAAEKQQREGDAVERERARRGIDQRQQEMQGREDLICGQPPKTLGVQNGDWPVASERARNENCGRNCDSASHGMVTAPDSHGQAGGRNARAYSPSVSRSGCASAAMRSAGGAAAPPGNTRTPVSVRAGITLPIWDRHIGRGRYLATDATSHRRARQRAPHIE
jgi:hypothetical protein